MSARVAGAKVVVMICLPFMAIRIRHETKTFSRPWSIGFFGSEFIGDPVGSEGLRVVGDRVGGMLDDDIGLGRLGQFQFLFFPKAFGMAMPGTCRQSLSEGKD